MNNNVENFIKRIHNIKIYSNGNQAWEEIYCVYIYIQWNLVAIIESNQAVHILKESAKWDLKNSGGTSTKTFYQTEYDTLKYLFLKTWGGGGSTKRW